VHALDARHEFGLLAVANARVLEGLLTALTDAGVRPALVQPSLLALSRVLRHSGRDADAPQLIVNLAEGGLELGISYQGQLLLDYFPSGHGTEDDAAAVVAKHWNRLQRHCARICSQANTRGAAAALVGGLLFGSAEDVRRAEASFRRFGALKVEVFDPASLTALGEYSDPQPGSEHGVVLGNLLQDASSRKELVGPNFMERVIAQKNQRLLPLAARTLWPIAAVLLVGLALGGVNFYENARCAELAHRIEGLEPARARASHLEMELTRARFKMEHLQQIRQAIANPAWDKTLTMLAQCLPDNTWLSRLDVSHDQKVTLSGASYSDEGAFEFVRWLEQVPRMENVQLEGMQTRRFESGPATLFDVKLNFAALNRPAGGKDRP
jgi:Tfp pilus assembly protein PilN